MIFYTKLLKSTEIHMYQPFKHSQFKSSIFNSFLTVESTRLQSPLRKFKKSRSVCMAGKVAGKIKLALDAGKASPAPPVGPALGAKGVNIMAFCKEYNAKTADKIGTIVPVEITVFEDKSYTLKLKTPPASVLI